jgi:hypothetical protein
METIYAFFIVVVLLITLSILTALVVKELRTLNATMGGFLAAVLKERMVELGLKKRVG